MKILIEREVSDDPIFCNGCKALSKGDWSIECVIFQMGLIDVEGIPYRCFECLSASNVKICACNSKKAPLSDSTDKVCECTCK